MFVFVWILKVGVSTGPIQEALFFWPSGSSILTISPTKKTYREYRYLSKLNSGGNIFDPWARNSMCDMSQSTLEELLTGGRKRRL